MRIEDTHRRLYNSLILICYHIYSKIYIIYSYQYLFQSFLIFNIHYIYKNKNICWLEGFILNNEFSCLLEDNISSRSISSFRIIQALRNNFKIFRDYAGNVRWYLPAFLCLLVIYKGIAPRQRFFKSQPQALRAIWYRHNFQETPWIFFKKTHRIIPVMSDYVCRLFYADL